ncbi:Microcin C7 self-immunity protein MccF [Clostridium perfringens]|uniref:S66 family peptidase n=1 Tax=Clostridium perfringens TaxID=1502 RepID=UPI001A3498EC|nr:LD-carboxypeptidase [Clostridium perfringens]MDG6887427.1 Microcin C7 self-immunity protein MccF [Clostridium perfringens]MDH5078861.1 Microcin C7 self-immunity protein MccF [Clostridium perfringens]HAT4141967.1 LD-carboxypeptidase [Clostridium perfringens]HBI7027482.1 LD-carboxypeptidase [Clostridium perfringens]HBI7035626.1 LD-carboxypeptidase [Clostridium perfringens]
MSMSFLNKGDKIGVISCSNGLNIKHKNIIDELKLNLKSLDIDMVEGDTLYAKEYNLFSGTGEEKARALEKLFLDKDIKMIFDISGGDLANEVLDFLDFNLIKENPKPFFGYSDLTVLLNAIYSQCHIATYNYQLRNLIGKFKEEQMQNFKASFIEGKEDIFNLDYKWINGSHLEGRVVGGNIRCLLKLAGTKYMPDFKDKILFLESFSGNSAKMVTYITQYKNLGVFNEVKGIILGEFTEMEREDLKPDIVEILKRVIGEINIPILKTRDLGHGADAKCIPIGKYLILK